MPEPRVFHGITLSPEKPQKGLKKPSARWTYGARLNPEMAATIDRMAREANAKPSDIVRSALAFFFASAAEANGPVSNLTEPTLPPSISQPRLKPAYKGSGGSDFNSIRKLQSQASRLKHASTPGKLSDPGRVS